MKPHQGLVLAATCQPGWQKFSVWLLQIFLPLPVSYFFTYGRKVSCVLMEVTRHVHIATGKSQKYFLVPRLFCGGRGGGGRGSRGLTVSRASGGYRKTIPMGSARFC